MGLKTFACPNCTCIQSMPQVDSDGAEIKCISCKVPISISAGGKVTTAPIAPKS